jgi:polyvinyl alcohol dehydrogenase (cytochrome)
MQRLGETMKSHLRNIALPAIVLIATGTIAIPSALTQNAAPPVATAQAAPPLPTATPVAAGQLANSCVKHVFHGPWIGTWASWGANTENWRFVWAMNGVSAVDVPNLKLKWAFGIPNAKIVRSQPAAANGRVFVGGNDGTVYSLDAITGCTDWATTAEKPVRSGLAIGRAVRDPAIFFGDAGGSVYALDAGTGKLVWAVRADNHPNATITGTPTWYDNRLYVPISSGEEGARRRPEYECCTFRGSVVALDAATGKKIWQSYMAADAPAVVGKTKDGHNILAPSGMAIWSSPTIDAVKGRIYVGTGDNYSDPPTKTSDAVVALDMNDGKILWSVQFGKDDVYRIDCGDPPREGCSPPTNPEFDLGASPILVSRVPVKPGGRVAAVDRSQLRELKRQDALILGQKTGLIYAVDPDAQGKLLWHARVGAGGLLGGVQWGPATDGTNVYVAVSDLAFQGRSPDPTKGGGISAYRVSDGQLLWRTPPPGCGDRRPCSPAQSQAVTAIPGAVFSGSIDGHLRVYADGDGKIIWDFDTARDFDTVNKVPAHGGSLDVGGPIVAGGMVFVVSGYPGFGAMPGNVLLAFAAK